MAIFCPGNKILFTRGGAKPEKVDNFLENCATSIVKVLFLLNERGRHTNRLEYGTEVSISFSVVAIFTFCI